MSNKFRVIKRDRNGYELSKYTIDISYLDPANSFNPFVKIGDVRGDIGELGALAPDTSIWNIRPPTFGNPNGVGLSLPTTPTNSTVYTPVYIPPPPPRPATTGTAQTIANSVSSQLRFDQIAALISQGITAWGRNPTQQISGYTVQAVQQPQQQQSYAPYGSGGLTPEQQAYLVAQSNAQRTTGGALGSGLDGIVNWATSNPIIVFAGIAGVYLLMREPPRSRR